MQWISNRCRRRRRRRRHVGRLTPRWIVIFHPLQLVVLLTQCSSNLVGKYK